MATGPKIVHKQFNSPIGLYSQQNIKETLSKHMQNLDNGTVGIDFSNPSTDKPANLANSAVLRMLEEEERSRMGYPKLDPTQVQAILETLVHMDHRFDRHWPPEQARMRSARSWDGQLNTTGNVYSEFMQATKGQKKVVWPPLPETNGYHSPQSQQTYNAQQQQQYQSPPPSQQSQYQQPQYQKPQYQQQQNQYQQPEYDQPQSHYQASQPAQSEGRRQQATGLSKLIPFGPGVTASPAPPRQGPTSPGVAQPYRQQNTRWAPVPAPLSPQAYGSQPNYSPQPQYSPHQQQYSPQQQQYSPQQQQYSPQKQQYSPQQQQYSPQPQYSEPAYQPPQRQFEPPPATITLRQKQPVHQKPPPVFPSQPATTSFKGGVNMRGDQKWPPQSVKEAVEAENEARRQLAKGPACRPRKLKQYSLAELIAMNEV
ncbi:chromatin modification-related protein eaf-1-like isoform X2 [Hyposmocoma kahamanoa]|uniref:chromatin modification-related protein eaf-1-like isoform X2 n=1 Tax=Hyposmocoma kahamanoa TaxID=1477025 RepID=UPI000E6D969C|nr:chromatin modification-related protein eaf-1-like isoform X2 [Hyposmocoma kahamanoa]